MASVTDEGFIVIDGQVAMPEETLAALLNTSVQRIENTVPLAGMKYQRGGIYFRDGKYYFASPEAVYRIYNYGDFSTKLSSDVVIALFKAAEKRLLVSIPLLSTKWLEVARQETGLAILFVMAFLFFGLGGCYVIFSSLSSNSVSPPIKTTSPVSEEKQRVNQLKENFYSETYRALEAVTGLRVTEKWMRNFKVREDSNGEITTYGYVEFENDGVKRPFWVTFKESTRKVLRVDIDTAVVYVADDW